MALATAGGCPVQPPMPPFPHLQPWMGSARGGGRVQKVSAGRGTRAGMDLVGGRGLTCPAPGPLCLGQQQLGSGGLPGHGLAVRPARLPRGVSVRPSVRPGDCTAAAPRREGGAWGRRRRVSAATSAPSEPARGLGTAGCTGGLGRPGSAPALPSRARGSRRIGPGRAVRGGGRRHRLTWARAAKTRGAGLCRGAGRRVTPLRRPWLAAAWTAGAPAGSPVSILEMRRSRSLALIGCWAQSVAVATPPAPWQRAQARKAAPARLLDRSPALRTDSRPGGACAAFPLLGCGPGLPKDPAPADSPPPPSDYGARHEMGGGKGRTGG